MLSAVRMATLSRTLAVLVAIGLSGADDVAASLAPEPPHRCNCAVRRSPDHHCQCPICARHARRAMAGEDRREDERLAREGHEAGVREDCGGAGAGLALHHHDAFLLPTKAGFLPPGRPAREGPSLRLAPAFLPAPEPPRPRA